MRRLLLFSTCCALASTKAQHAKHARGSGSGSGSGHAHAPFEREDMDPEDEMHAAYGHAKRGRLAAAVASFEVAVGGLPHIPKLWTDLGRSLVRVAKTKQTRRTSSKATGGGGSGQGTTKPDTVGEAIEEAAGSENGAAGGTEAEAEAEAEALMDAAFEAFDMAHWLGDPRAAKLLARPSMASRWHVDALSGAMRTMKSGTRGAHLTAAQALCTTLAAVTVDSPTSVARNSARGRRFLRRAWIVLHVCGVVKLSGSFGAGSGAPLSLVRARKAVLDIGGKQSRAHSSSSNSRDPGANSGKDITADADGFDGVDDGKEGGGVSGDWGTVKAGNDAADEAEQDKGDGTFSEAAEGDEPNEDGEDAEEGDACAEEGDGCDEGGMYGVDKVERWKLRWEEKLPLVYPFTAPEIAMNSRVLSVVKAALSTNVEIDTFSAVTSFPGAPDQPWHRDVPAQLFHVPGTPLVMLCLASVVACFTSHTPLFSGE